MSSIPVDVARVLEALGPWRIAHRFQLRDAGVSGRQLRAATDQGLVVPVRRDWFAGAECRPALLRSVHAGATLGCVSAAAAHGLWALDDESIHVSVARNTPRIHRPPPAVPGQTMSPLTLHWTRDPEPRLAPRVRALITSVPRTLSQVAACQPLERAVAVIDSALRRRKVALHEMREAARGDRALARVLEYADASADAETESLARVRLARRGVVMMPQVVIDGHPVDGLIGTRLIHQIDGYGPHSDRRQRNRDLEQDDRLRRLGFIVLRYSGDHVRWQWQMIESAVLGLVAAGKHLSM